MPVDFVGTSWVLDRLYRRSGGPKPIESSDLRALAEVLPDAEKVLLPREILEVDLDVFLVLLVEGEAEILHGVDATVLPERACLVGLDELLTAWDGRLALRALTRCVCVPIPVERLDEVVDRVDWMKATFERLDELGLDPPYWVKRSSELGSTAFSLPGGALVPGPYKADDVDLYLFVMQDDPDRVSSLLPRGLLPLPGCEGRYLLAFAHFADLHPCHALGKGLTLNYKETAVLIPCVGWGGPALHAPFLCPDTFPAVLLGRDLYGFSKQRADTRMDLFARTVDFALPTGRVLRAGWEGSVSEPTGAFFQGIAGSLFPRDPAGRVARDLVGRGVDLLQKGWFHRLWPRVRILVRNRRVAKAFPGERKPTFVSEGLVAIPLVVERMRGFQKLQAPAIAWFDQDFSTKGSCVGAWRLALGIGLDPGRELCSFGAPLRERVRNLRWKARGLAAWLFHDREPFLEDGLDITELRHQIEYERAREVGVQAEPPGDDDPPL